jgi:hypothetical protein
MAGWIPVMLSATSLARNSTADATWSAVVIRWLGSLSGHPGLRVRRCDGLRGTRHSHASDRYLLALARAKHGRLTTLGRKLANDGVPDGQASLAII